jgi:NMD protein affecting ribosome stability and mRNA decay
MAHNPEQQHSMYFEAILQLRDVSQKVIDYAEDEIHRVKLKVAKTVKVKNGTDYYLSNNSLTRALGKRLKERFGGNNKETASLWGVKKDREVYRVTVLFRGVPFKKKDIVIYDGEEYKIVSLKKDIFMQEVNTGKKVHIKYDNMDRIKLKEN